MLDHCRNSSLEHASGDISNTVKKREGKQLQMKMLAGKQTEQRRANAPCHPTKRRPQACAPLQEAKAPALYSRKQAPPICSTTCSTYSWYHSWRRNYNVEGFRHKEKACVAFQGAGALKNLLHSRKRTPQPCAPLATTCVGNTLSSTIEK